VDVSTIEKKLHINSRTTGFASPAESYVNKRLDLNELIIKDVHSTFYFQYSGPNVLGVENGNVLVIDRSEEPKVGDLVVLTDKSHFKIREYDGQPNLWGRVSWILNKL
jgi:SOS-response transcriptional repressor LexA